MKKVFYQKGFTLIEILASVLVLVAVGSVISGIVSASLRGAGKTNSIEKIRQNGNYALNQMSKDIQYAQSFDGIETGFSNDQVTFHTYCSGILSDPPSMETNYTYVSVKSSNNIETVYNCNGNILTAKIDSGTTTQLIDSSLGLSDCQIKCKQSKITDVPLVKISFRLQSSGLVEKAANINFETSVTMRNYKK